MPTALIIRLNFDAVLLCSLNMFGCVNGLLHSFVFLYVIVWVVVLCSLNVFGCVNGLLHSFVYLFDCDCIVCGIVFVKCIWVCKWIIAFVRVFV